MPRKFLSGAAEGGGRRGRCVAGPPPAKGGLRTRWGAARSGRAAGGAGGLGPASGPAHPLILRCCRRHSHATGSRVGQRRLAQIRSQAQQSELPVPLALFLPSPASPLRSGLSEFARAARETGACGKPKEKKESGRRGAAIGSDGRRGGAVVGGRGGALLAPSQQRALGS